jgi:hypothetical protein
VRTRIGMFPSLVPPLPPADRPTDRMTAVIVTSPIEAGHTSSPLQLIGGACSGVFSLGEDSSLLDAFTADAVPEFDKSQ